MVPHLLSRSHSATNAIGYAGWKCELSEIEASFAINLASGKRDGEFDAIGGRTFLPGSIEKRPGRRAGGELRSEPCALRSGISAVTISDFFLLACRDLKHDARCAASPSLVRNVRAARLIFVNFCRARVQCSRCFRFCVECRRREPSTESGLVANANSSDAQTDLCCPSNCPSKYAKVYWEVSGTLDDGTGQAKLHAERDIAIVLLGKGLDVKTIEAAAWKRETGILFNRSANAFANHAKNRARTDHRRGRPASVESEAEFKMHAHCCESTEPLRRLNFFCRFKPVNDECFFKQTEIRVIESGDSGYEGSAVTRGAATFTLPLLRLHLVQCQAMRENRKIGWDLIRSLTRSADSNGS